jgi:hypothetical protein
MAALRPYGIIYRNLSILSGRPGRRRANDPALTASNHNSLVSIQDDGRHLVGSIFDLNLAD